jgi:cephalosporin hydroxylase
MQRGDSWNSENNPYTAINELLKNSNLFTVDHSIVNKCCTGWLF